ncbi:MAG: restriction endonuclease subunit S [Treponema sp.]|uniref:restriction endonuclease subunit S n=1 Tax=Treponema sp. TaxID=166 RepID=UPI00298E9AE9|nr:restriction endonuclease subunit S [Treponema sp.]MCQ2601390.1 restriction endonuclease subunit S [Treponema sp.]
MKNYTCLLKEIADIRTGYSFRAKIQPDFTGNTLVVQLKELSEKNTIDISTAVKIAMPEISENYLLKKGDLVFRSRGMDSTAAIMNIDADNVILSAPFQRIRINTSLEMIPEYLLWYINSKEAQTYFTTNKTGTSVSMISTAVLADLPVVVPSLEIQKQIIEINTLALKEIELQEELIKKKKLLTETILLNVIRP